MTVEDIKVGMCFMSGKSMSIRLVENIDSERLHDIGYTLYMTIINGRYVSSGYYKESAEKFISRYADKEVHAFINEKSELEML